MLCYNYLCKVQNIYKFIYVLQELSRKFLRSLTGRETRMFWTSLFNIAGRIYMYESVFNIARICMYVYVYITCTHIGVLTN